MPKCYQLVGVPGAGKSTWVANQDWAGACAHISTDKLIDLRAAELGLTYNQVFKEYMPTATSLMNKEVEDARAKGNDVIWDQTSTSIASRKRKFKMLPDYEHIAVVFRTPEKEELLRRLNSRPGKSIPAAVIEKMATDLELEPPSIKEGFKEIWYAE